MAPSRPQDLIDEHRAKRQEQEEAQEEDPEATPLPPYVLLPLREAKEEMEYIKAHIEQWNRWNKEELGGVLMTSRVSGKDSKSYMWNQHAVLGSRSSTLCSSSKEAGKQAKILTNG